MKPINSYLKINIIGQLILIIFLLTFLLNETYAKAGCCANHGGVAGCNASTNYQKCNDGTTSPTCSCGKAKTSNPTKSLKSTTITPKAASTAKSATSNSAKALRKHTSTKSSRCCARHGGVAQCNKVTGYQQCKDKTMSPTCKC